MNLSFSVQTNFSTSMMKHHDSTEDDFAGFSQSHELHLQHIHDETAPKSLAGFFQSHELHIIHVTAH